MKTDKERFLIFIGSSAWFVVFISDCDCQTIGVFLTDDNIFLINWNNIYKTIRPTFQHSNFVIPKLADEMPMPSMLQLSVAMMSWVRVWLDFRLFTTQLSCATRLTHKRISESICKQSNSNSTH